MYLAESPDAAPTSKTVKGLLESATARNALRMLCFAPNHRLTRSKSRRIPSFSAPSTSSMSSGNIARRGMNRGEGNKGEIAMSGGRCVFLETWLKREEPGVTARLFTAIATSLVRPLRTMFDDGCVSGSARYCVLPEFPKTDGEQVRGHSKAMSSPRLPGRP